MNSPCGMIFKINVYIFPEKLLVLVAIDGDNYL